MITKRQAMVYAFIEKYQMKNGKSPTLKEIRGHLNVSSDNGVLKHLAALEKKGYISKDDTPRGIRLLASVKEKLEAETSSIPILGSVPAGGAVITEENIDGWMQIDSKKYKNPKTLFLLRVTGNSMIEAGIFEGDLLLVDSSRTVKENDIVIALVDNENTVKRLVKKEGKFYLKAENPEYRDIYPMNSLQIQGVVLELFRSY